MHIVFDPECTTYASPGHPENPRRVTRTVALLESQADVPLTWLLPKEVPPSALDRVHPRSHLDRLEQPFDFDPDTPDYPGIAARARASVGGALTCLDLALAGEPAFSLLRPPGHHARPVQAMGFCYLNQAAIAALEANAAGLTVAVYDFDVHHGNGTEEILLGRPGLSYTSVHQFPCYPGTGAQSRDNAHNYPVRPLASRSVYRSAIDRSLDAVLASKPDLIVVSAGFDAFRGDPLSQAPLEHEDYLELGRRIRASGIRNFAILEGGYSDELPELILAYLMGVAGGRLKTELTDR